MSFSIRFLRKRPAICAAGALVTMLALLVPMVSGAGAELPDPLPEDLLEDPLGGVESAVGGLVGPEPSPSPSPSPSSEPDPAPAPQEGPTSPVDGGGGGGSGGGVSSSDTEGLVETVSEEAGPVGAGWSYFPVGGRRSTMLVLDLIGPDAGVEKIARVLAPFPVAGPAHFSDDWGAPRFVPDFHYHEGVDVFAAPGTPVIASADGVITRVHRNTTISGNGLRLTAPDGTYFVYSHLDGFAPGLYEGKNVGLGEVIGYVGSTGNAEGGPPHLHYEIHPYGGAAVPPVPYLDLWLANALAVARSLGGLLGASVSVTSPFSTLDGEWVTVVEVGPPLDYSLTAAVAGETSREVAGDLAWLAVIAWAVCLMLGANYTRRRLREAAW